GPARRSEPAGAGRPRLGGGAGGRSPPHVRRAVRAGLARRRRRRRAPRDVAARGAGLRGGGGRHAAAWVQPGREAHRETARRRVAGVRSGSRPRRIMTSSPAPDGSLERALSDLEAHAESAVRALQAAAKAAKRVQAAAATGLLRDVAQGIDATVRLAAEAGLPMFELDDRLLSYPSIVSVSPSDASVVIDKKKDRRLRPSVVVGLLAAISQRPPKFKPEPFLEALAKAYDLVAPRPGATVKLVDVYRALTLLPGSGREYTKAEFARDVYLLDQSGITTTKDGREMSLPASALTRSGGTLTTVAKGGQVKVYAGLCFNRRSA